MIKFQNQDFAYQQAKYQQMPPKQKPAPNYNLQETFGQQYFGRVPQPQQQQQYKQPYQNLQQQPPPPQQQPQQQLQPQYAQQKPTQQQNVQFTAKEFNQLFYKQQNMKVNENQEEKPLQKVPGNERQMSTYQNKMPTRMQSADPAVQNRNALNNIQNQQQQQQQLAQKTSQYISNGKPDYSQRQATPMKDQMKFMSNISYHLDQKQQQDQQMNLMYSPMPKSQLLSETTNLAKLQQQQLQQNRSPQIQKVGGSGMGSVQTNAQQIVEELAKEKERHQLLTAKLKKLEMEKKSYNTQFLNDMEGKIKGLIQENDQLQNLNMELLQKAQEQPQGEVQELNKQIAYNSQQLDFLQKQITEAQKQLSEQMKKYKDLEVQYQEKNQNEEQQIQFLVSDLEEKVHGLIAENERLNQMISSQDNNPKKEQLQQLNNEKNKLVQMTQQSQKEVSNWKNKYEQLQQKLQSADKFVEPQGEQVEALEEKIKSLIEENDYLNTVVQQQIERENQIALLEEEMQNLVEQNDNLEMLLQNSTKK